MSTIALSSLTARQREIVMLAANGLSNKEIARRLGLSEGTVKLHLTTSTPSSGSEIVQLLLGWFTRPDPLSFSQGMVFQDLLEGGRNASQRLLGLRGSYGFRHVCGITGRLGQRQPSPYEFPLAAVG